MQYVDASAPHAEPPVFFERVAASPSWSTMLAIGCCACFVALAAALGHRLVVAESRATALHAQDLSLHHAAVQVQALTPIAAFGETVRCSTPCTASLPATDDPDAVDRYRELAAALKALQAAQSMQNAAGHAVASPVAAAGTGLPGLRLALREAHRTLVQQVEAQEAERRRAARAVLWTLAGAVGAMLLLTATRLRLARQWLAAGLAAERAARAGRLEDPLTRLANHRAFALHLPRMLAAAQRAARPVAMLLVDIDGFRGINRQHGRDGGDELLRLFAQRLYGHLRDADVVARLADDRFAVALEGAESEAGAHAAAERIRETLAEPARLTQSDDPGAPRVAVTVSIGLALFPSPARSVDSLLAQAEEALGRAKRRGGNCTAVAGDDADEPQAQACAALDQRRRSAFDSITTGTSPTSTIASDGSAASASRSSRAKL